MDISILIVDDDKEIANLIEIYLVNEGYRIFKAYDGKQALEVLAQEKVSAVILDIMMPVMDGMEVCKQIRRDIPGLPILMLSAKAEDMDKIMGLMTGADDYLVKPFNPLELVARLKSLLRRALYLNKLTSEHTAGTSISIHSLTIDQTAHTATVEGRPISLTSKEFDILYLLASHPGRVFSAEEIFEKVWQEKYFESNNTVMVHISNLRDKLEKELGEKLIQTVWGVGYKIER
jgi:two-component system, OmpR family, response regulator VanR